MQYREIPYNYTAFSDQEIVNRYLGKDAWTLICNLHVDRNTGRSARILFEILGDMWVVGRNPYLQDDLIKDKRRQKALIEALYHHLRQIKKRINSNQQVLDLLATCEYTMAKFKDRLAQFEDDRKHINKVLLKVTSQKQYSI